MAGLCCGGHGYKGLDPAFGEEIIISDRGLGLLDQIMIIIRTKVMPR